MSAPRVLTSSRLAGRLVAGSIHDALQTSLNEARDNILLLNFQPLDASVVTLLSEASDRGVQVHVIMDRMNGELGRLRSRLPSLVRLSTNVETEGFEDAVMHSKCVVVDQNIVIIGSWNFTSYGLHSNLELGIITSDHQLAMDIQSWLDSCFHVGALVDL